MDTKHRFAAVRKHYNLTMSAFGEKIGLSASGVSAIEYGTRDMNEKHIKLICAAFPSVNDNWLRTGEGEMLLQTNDSLLDQLVDKYSLTPMEAGIMAKFIRMDADQRAMFLEVARILLDAGSQAQSEAVAREVVSRAVPPEPESQIG